MSYSEDSASTVHDVRRLRAIRESGNKLTVSRVDPAMGRTGVSGSSSGQAVGFDPGGLSHMQTDRRAA